MDAKRGKLLVFSNPVDGQEDEYNNWYDNQHLADVVAVEGVISAQRYEAVDSPLAPVGTYRYLAIYEIDGDLAKIRAEMTKRVQDGRMPVSGSIDGAGTTSSVWAPRGPEVVGPA